LESYSLHRVASVDDPVAGKEDARRLLDLPLTVMCAAHAVPNLDGCRAILQGAVELQDRRAGSSARFAAGTESGA
jgi:hypothetical protein